MTWEDPIVAEVRRIRESLSAERDFDLAAIFADFRTRQETVGDRLVKLDRNQHAKKAEKPKQTVRSD